MSTDQVNGHKDAQIVQLHPPGGPPDTAPAEAPPVYADKSGPVAGQRRPVIPDDWRRHNLKSTLRQAGGLHWHRAKYHAVRSPGYAGRTGFYAVRGAVRLTGRVLRWWHWVDGWLLESAAVARGGTMGHADAMKAHAEGKRTRGQRGWILAGCLGGAVVALLLMAEFAPWWAWAALALAVLVVLVRHGKPEGGRITAQAVVPTRLEPPTQESILRALGALGVPLLTAAVKDGGRGITFVTPIHRDGPGWSVRIDLPHGVTAVDVIEKRERLASGLRRPLSATWPSPMAHEHAGQVELWIGFEALNKAKPLSWPLARAGKASLFEPIPFGGSQRGKIISITLMFASVLIGAMPRMGKTFALRVLALGAALDPTARLRIWELKGTGDLAALKHVAHEYGSGADDDTLRECLESVRKLHAQLDIRAKTLRELPDEVRPENKVTPQLCARRGLGLFPEVLIIDECQEAYSSPGYGKEFDTLTTAIIKRGPALGIMLILATQRPDAQSLPKPVSANIGIRYCLRMMGTYENNAVLGPGMYARGIRATDFALSDKGIGWLAGHADDPEIVRGCYIDAPAADTIARRARAAREAAGTLSGFALGEDTSDPARDFLADVLSVFGPDEANLWSETIAARLAGQLPGAYEAITQEAVASQLRAAGVTVKPVRETGKSTRSGAARSDVEASHA